MCQLIDDELATEALRIFLQVDNFKTFYAVCHAIEEKGINVLAALWPILIQKKDNQSVDKMSEVLLSLFGLTKIFELLLGISKPALVISKIEEKKYEIFYYDI